MVLFQIFYPFFIFRCQRFQWDISGSGDLATTAEDFLALAERCGKLAAYCGGVAAEIARSGDAPLKTLTEENKEWVKNLK